MILYFVICIFIILYISYVTRNHKNKKKRKITNKYILVVLINIIISVFVLKFIFETFSFSNDIQISLPNIISYLLLVDTLNYWTHRIIHRTPILKKWLHQTHHDCIDLLPSDIFYLNCIEHTIYNVLNQVIPLLFITVNIFEYILIMIIYFLYNIYLHSEDKHNFVIPYFVNSKFHKKHHHIGGGNYSIFFNIWDKYMNTIIKKRL